MARIWLPTDRDCLRDHHRPGTPLPSAAIGRPPVSGTGGFIWSRRDACRRARAIQSPSSVLDFVSWQFDRQEQSDYHLRQRELRYRPTVGQPSRP